MNQSSSMRLLEKSRWPSHPYWVTLAVSLGRGQSYLSYKALVDIAPRTEKMPV
jgi:hypothetical protein